MPMFPNWPAQEPVTTPAPGDESLSAFEEAADDGQLRSKSAGDTTFQETPHPVAQYGSEYPFQAPVGTPRQAYHPAGPVGTIHPTDWPYQGGGLGTHGELVQTASPPVVNGRAPFGVSPKTWRAAPAPWDEAAYVGWTPANPDSGD